MRQWCCPCWPSHLSFHTTQGSLPPQPPDPPGTRHGAKFTEKFRAKGDISQLSTNENRTNQTSSYSKVASYPEKKAILGSFSNICFRRKARDWLEHWSKRWSLLVTLFPREKLDLTGICRESEKNVLQVFFGGWWAHNRFYRGI